MSGYNKGGLIHREDGPAVEFKDGRKLWALDGREVTEQEATVRREENDRQAREQSDALWERHQADELNFLIFGRYCSRDFPVNMPTFHGRKPGSGWAEGEIV